MVNTRLQKAIRKAFKIDQMVVSTPNATPVVEVGNTINPLDIIETGQATGAGAISAVIYHTPNSHDFHIVGANISSKSDSSSTNNKAEITFIKNGITKTLLCIADMSSNSLEANSSQLIIGSHTIIPDRDTDIIVKNSTAVNYNNTLATVYGFLDDVN